MSLRAEALTVIEQSLRRLERPTIALLNPGLAADAVRPLLASRGLEPPSDLLGLWEWRNGTDPSTGATLGDLWLVPGYYLLSVDDATMSFDAFVRDPRWDASWLPVLADGGGYFLAVKCSAGEDHGAVHHFRVDESEQPLEFRSVERMLATFAAAFDRGIFYMDGNGFLEEDSGAFATLAAELNPSVGWWRDPVE